MPKTSTKKQKLKGFKRLPKGPNGGIQLLLIQSVEHLGQQGEVVEVKAGYANNYLLPQGLATLGKGSIVWGHLAAPSGEPNADPEEDSEANKEEGEAGDRGLDLDAMD